ncbi:DUF2975 domain-containing protein [Salegentibacter salarius]|uniref:DUF2975 domain-containing protein n=1 Tax=Salegentibacter salarius TaxID=435906 RepID=A0A2N0TV54_9FLAO|nr:DUF2975 domain-containing protein [Salegentibacter salarius]OEY72270.1 hypothetical protein BHS39_03230 [Salegentibacter salarius]PKD18591.1 hypothetical protein APR40_03230 [Salegentibacter salarius]SLJ88443.1 Protein of unknown function [Salegentibacter salarius]
MILGWILLFGFLLYAIFISPSDILEIFRDAEEFEIKSKNALYTSLSYELLSSGVWIFILYLFKNLMQDLIAGPLFTKLQIASFKLIGQLIIFITILNELFRFVYKVIFNKRIEINFDHFNLWFVIFGLFLIFLSKIFNQARIIKEENELTV